MATYATLTVNAKEVIGERFTNANASVWVEPDTPHGLIVVDGTTIRIGGRREVPDAFGIVTFPDLVTTNSADNPRPFGYRVTIECAPTGSRTRDPETIVTSSFPLTSNKNLADIDEAWDNITAPPSWRSDFRDEMEGLRDEVEADRAYVEARVVDDLGTTDGQTTALVETPSSLTTQALSSRYARQDRRALNVKDFGAKGDGITNDSPAFQAAFDEAEARGGARVDVPDGTYNIGTGLQIGSNTHLDLDSGAVLLRGTSAYANMIRNKSDGSIGGYDASKNITISGGVIDGNGFNHTTNCTLVGFAHAKGITIRDMRMTNLSGTWHCVELNGVQHGQILNCEFDNSLDVFSTELVQIDLMKDSAVWPWFGPYDNTPCNNIIVSGCYFHDSTATGIGSHTSGTASTEIVITNNVFRSVHWAIKPWDWGHLEISRNDIFECFGGIIWNGAPAAVVSDIAITNNRMNLKPASQGRGIGVIGGTSGAARNIRAVNISNNIIREAGRYGIGVDWGTGAVISGNVITNTGTYDNGSAQNRIAIWVYNTNDAIVRGNVVRDTNVGGLPGTVVADLAVGADAGGTSDTVVSDNIFAGSAIVNQSTRCLTTGNIIKGALTTGAGTTGHSKAANVVAGTYVP
ncbi:right-handed parallel beta-helix repeat-containing protein [Nocardioides lacusdianchii]|uniref:right-handed parallel beta-helix repeat-containing protein n=1 Tax=Nocardioides lacusdianchii TaxID=2783664 RepID=UPI001CCE5CE1|nr:right-handed parallel beta-helix repeat-containing protein [Nocardioides lacusdianchii]